MAYSACLRVVSILLTINLKKCIAQDDIFTIQTTEIEEFAPASIEQPLVGTYGTRSSICLDQGHINYIEWGLSSDTKALVISYWTSSSQSADTTSFGTATHVPCAPAALSYGDYILGYTAFYDESYIYGLEFYTLTGQTFACYDSETVADKQYVTVKQDEYYTSNEDFYYLSGWIVYYGATINGITFQLTNIATSKARVEDLPDASFSASTEYYSSEEDDWGASEAKYSGLGWAAEGGGTGDWLQIDLLAVLQIESIGTKGAYDTYYGSEWVTSYEFAWSFDGIDWNSSLILNGNYDQSTEVLHVFDEPLIARYVEFTVLAINSWPCLRVEVYAQDYVDTAFTAVNISYPAWNYPTDTTTTYPYPDTTSDLTTSATGDVDDESAANIDTLFIAVTVIAVASFCCIYID